MKLSVFVVFGLVSLSSGFPSYTDTQNEVLEVVDGVDDIEPRTFFRRPVIFPPRRYPMKRGEIWTGPIGNINSNNEPFTYWSSNRGQGIVRIRDKNGVFYTLRFNCFRPPYVPIYRPTKRPTKEPIKPTELVTEPDDKNTDYPLQPNVTDPAAVTESQESNNVLVVTTDKL